MIMSCFYCNFLDPYDLYLIWPKIKVKLILERNVELESFQCCEQHKLNSSHLLCTGVEADISNKTKTIRVARYHRWQVSKNKYMFSYSGALVFNEQNNICMIFPDRLADVCWTLQICGVHDVSTDSQTCQWLVVTTYPSLCWSQNNAHYVSFLLDRDLLDDHYNTVLILA